MSCDKSYKKLSWFFFTIFTIGVFVYIVFSDCLIQGDGAEYVLQTVAIQNHFSLDIRYEDFIRAKKEYYNQSEYIENVINGLVGLQVTDAGKIYSNHFGAYSYIVVLVKYVLDFFHIYPIRAFYVTNLLLWMGAVGVVLCFLKTTWKKRFWISMLLMFNPVIYYVDWTHTEVYIFSFLVISLVFLYNRNYKLSILSISVASMQNVALLPFAAVIGIDYIIGFYESEKVKNSNLKLFGFLLTNWKRIIVYGFLYIPAFIPLVSSYMHFGTISVVAKLAREKDFLWEKAWGYIFDLNLGILPFMPFILMAFILMLFIGVIRMRRASLVNILGIGGVLYIISNQKQINSGMDTIMRYNVWIIPIIIFFVIMHWEIILNGIKILNMQIIVGLEILFTTIVIGFTIWGGGGYTNGQFAPWTQLVLDLAPQLYNPTHGIFYSRSTGGERYYSRYPAVYYDKNGYAKKILLNAESEQEFIENWRVFDKSGKQLDKDAYVEKARNRGGFKYINFNEDIIAARGNKYVEVAQWEDGESVVPGMYYREGDKCWASKQSLILLEDPLISEVGMELDIMPVAWLQSYIGEDFSLEIYINGHLIKDVLEYNYDSWNRIYISPEELQTSENKNGTYYVMLKSNSYGMPQDSREFSYLFKYIGAVKEIYAE